jgi:hypothetical protein
MSWSRRLRRDSRFLVQNAVSLAAKFRIERFEGSASSIPFSSSRAEQPPVRRTGLYTQTPAVPSRIIPPHSLRASRNIEFRKKENYYV